MPDYNPNRGPGEGPLRRTVKPPPARRYGPGGLPTEGADPAPKPWPIAPWIALIFMVGFLALQLWPETHFRHFKDPHKRWIEIVRTESGAIDHAASIERGHKVWLGERAEHVDSEAGLEELEDLDRLKAHERLRGQIAQDVEVFLSTDEKDLRPLAVVINSTIKNALHPNRINFHLIIPASSSEIEYFKLKSFFPSANIEIFSDEGIDLAEISKLVTYRKSTKARKELTTPYNFLLYYLPALLQKRNIKKFIYLDTDVVVKGDLEELYRRGLEGYPVAAVEDCSQHLEIYYDFKQLQAIQARENGSKAWIPSEPFDPAACVFNRGVLVIDVKQWIEQHVTESIEWWLREFNSSNKALFKYGLSQPPFLLALYKNYKVLDHPWNVRGLGRDKFSDKEMDYFESLYLERPAKKPFVSLETDYAKILHFNGEFKPWKRGRVRQPGEERISLCGEHGTECAKLWWEYLDPVADAKLK